MRIEAPVLYEPRTPLVVETLELDPPQRGEVLVRMVASGVCHSCLHVADGSHGGMPLPLVLGDEGSGIVEAIGDDCQALEVGDHVILSWAPGCGYCRYCLRERPALCVNQPEFGLMAGGTTRFHRDGSPVYHFGPSTYASHVVVAERAAVKIRKDVPLEYAALVGCAVSTGVGAVINSAGARPGESVVVVGCGGIGLNAVQGAALAGCNPIIGVDVVDSKLDTARAFGATHTFRADTPDLPAEVARVTNGGADYCVIAVGNRQAIESSIDLIGPGGLSLVVGAPSMDTRLDLDPFAFIGKEKGLVGVRYGSCSPARDFPRFIELYLADKLLLEPLISQRYKLSEVNEAMAALASGNETRGLIIYD